MLLPADLLEGLLSSSMSPNLLEVLRPTDLLEVLLPLDLLEGLLSSGMSPDLLEVLLPTDLLEVILPLDLLEGLLSSVMSPDLLEVLLPLDLLEELLSSGLPPDLLEGLLSSDLLSRNLLPPTSSDQPPPEVRWASSPLKGLLLRIEGDLLLLVPSTLLDPTSVLRFSSAAFW